MADVRVPRTGRGRPCTRPDHVLADKGYSSRTIRTYLRRRGIPHTIPERADQAAGRRRKGRGGGRPPGFDPQKYKQRNVVERCFNTLKQYRGIATRYDKTSESYLAAVTLASTLLWISLGRHALGPPLRPTPRRRRPRRRRGSPGLQAAP